MQEAIFNIRLKKWDEALKVLEANTDSLHSSEQDAINTLKNLWRTAQFGTDCTSRVERMIKVLSDSDKLHGNNREIVQASKDLRGVAKEMYTTDAATLRQFADAMQKANGGPRLSASQQARRATQRPVSNPRPTSNPKPTSAPRPTSQASQTRPLHRPEAPSSTPRRPASTNNRRSREPQRTPNPVVRYLMQTGPTLATIIIFLVVIGVGAWMAWNKATTIAPYNYAKLLRSSWNGEAAGQPSTLIIDTVQGNTIHARMLIKTKHGLQTDSLQGTMSIQREGCYVYLTRPTAGDSLTDNYRLFIARQGCSLNGNFISATSSKPQTVNLSNGGNGTLAHLANAGAPQYIIDPLLSDSVTCYRAVLKDTAWIVKDYSRKKVFPRGLMIDSCGMPRSTKYSVIFVNNGKHYQIRKADLLWSRTNIDSLQTGLSAKTARQHSTLGIFFSSLWPCWLVIGLVSLPLLFTIILPFALSRFETMRRILAVILNAMVVVMPLCLLIVAIIEAGGYLLFGGQAFWWCDKDRYGFIGSVLRILPFLIVVMVQVFSIWWYEGLLFQGEQGGKEIHMKPAVISFCVSIPALIACLLLTEEVLDWKETTAEWTSVALFFGILLIGVIITLVRNIREVGALKGSLITAFVLVYIIGCMVAIGGLVVAVLKVLIPLLCGLFGLSILAGGLLGGGRGETLYRDSYGNLYRRV